MQPKDFNSNQYGLPSMDMSLVHSSVEVAISFKKCSKCNKEKSLFEFSKSKSNKYGVRSYCKKCDSIVNKIYRDSNKKYLKEYLKDWYKDNKKNFLAQQKKYKFSNRQNINDHLKERRQFDINFKIRDNLTTRIWFALNRGIKSTGTMKLLGCSIEFLKTHLESKFKEGMSWGNYSKFGWHIDHIKPCSSFNLSDKEEQLKCFNYTNLQPLWWYENLEKSNKY